MEHASLSHMHSITGSKNCQCVFHTGATGVKTIHPCQVSFFAQSLNQGGEEGNVKYAKNLSKNMSLLNLGF